VDAVAHIPIGNDAIIVGCSSIVVSIASVLEVTLHRGPELVLKRFQLTGDRSYLELTIFLRIILSQASAIVNVIIATATPPAVTLALIGPVGPRPAIVIVSVLVRIRVREVVKVRNLCRIKFDLGGMPSKTKDQSLLTSFLL
jgi:hypothetical protein